MKSITQRIITATVALPLLLLVILFLPQANYLAFCLVVLIVDLIGTYEMRAMVDKDRSNGLMPSFLCATVPVSTYIECAFFPQVNLTLYTFICLISIGFAIEAFTGGKDNFAGSRTRLEIFALEAIYPNLFATFLIRMAFLPDARYWILLFLAFVFGSDTFAYLFGMWLGKNNRGIIKVSPNKSIAGFIFGLLLPALFGLLIACCAEGLGMEWYHGLILGFMTSLAGTCGDLIESAFKRSAQIKDSGKAIPGRGGVLDSIDSILIAAPVFILLLHIF
jgi:CDP-diglyceride synthetase